MIITLTTEEYAELQDWFSVYYYESGMNYDMPDYDSEDEYRAICDHLNVDDIELIGDEYE